MWCIPCVGMSIIIGHAASCGGAYAKSADAEPFEGRKVTIVVVVVLAVVMWT